jgi:hypothetical protein
VTDRICGILLLKANILIIVWYRFKATTREVNEIFLKKEMKEKDADFIQYTTTVIATLMNLAKKNIPKVKKSQKYISI